MQDIAQERAAAAPAERRPSSFPLRCVDLCAAGPVDYDHAHALQLRLLAVMIADPAEPDRLILLEHAPVVTIGRGGSPENILADAAALADAGVACRHVARGGDVTYHGPGQLVAYPLRRLEGPGRDLHRYLRDLEAVLIATLADFGIAGRRREGLTGVWIGQKKIASIGVAVKRWISWHGVALNVESRLANFRIIRPCGIEGVKMTSMADAAGRQVTVAEAKAAFLARFIEQFGYNVA
jgi:lipoate-protein ligase B